ncbi:hypothetical protein BD410DRAFT_843493 [Rickenella mellea]|uniref:Uncharacterized protein n=1 Tax=Rickenella mellea TaxID=50990 RepID=A0A4Y7PQB6_9AGAM|nr:hypothetical protein BD410DRAFT_843493 [Rickenella mellea]
MYGLHCTCRLCQSQLAEAESDTPNARLSLLDTAPTIYAIHEKPGKAAQDLDKLCTRLESTYVDPPTIQPRFCYIDKLSLLSLSCTMTGDRKRLLETSLRGLSALGFEAQVDETGHLEVWRHGHCGQDVVMIAVMPASWLTHKGLLSETASWKAIVREALDVQEGHWTYHTKPLTMEHMHPIDLSDSD